MALIIPLVIAGIVAVFLISIIPKLVMHTIGQLLLSRPDDFEGWCYYGGLLERAGHYLDAYNAYRQSMTINPEYFEAQRRLDALIARMENHRATPDSFNQLDLEPE